MIKKIVAIGPESTGKTSLCEHLALHYNTKWVPEYAREYLLTNGIEYHYDDLYKIALGQVDSEEKMSTDLYHAVNEHNGHKPLFIDTDLQVIKVWSEFVFNKCDNRILTNIADRQYDLFLLCNIDLPWVKDELREYPDLINREILYHYYKDLLVQQEVPWIDISGNYEQRLEIAIKTIDDIVT